MVIKSPEDFHNKLGFVFHALLALPLAAFVYLFLEIKHRNLTPAVNDQSAILTLQIILPLIAAAAIGTGYILLKRNLKIVNSYQTLRQKLSAYFSVALNFYLFIGVAAVLFVLGLYLTTSSIFIIGYVLLLFLMSLNRPHLQQYIKDLRLTKEERDILLHKKPFEDAMDASSKED